MRKRIDPSAMIGQTFGSWTVLDYAGKNKSGQDQYLCRCECGTERAVSGPALRYGHSKSCGCGKRRFDLTGQTFGLWTVLKDAGQDKYGHDQYLCRCACGTERVVIGPVLRRGTSASCGCYRGKRAKRVTDDAVIGQKFGSWEVLESAGSTKGGSRLYLCRCQCGTERLITLHNLTKGKSKSCGCGRFVNRSDTDLTGQRFGAWTVLGKDETVNSKQTYYKCRCVCGTERSVRARTLIDGLSRSCGCMRKKPKILDT